MKNSMEWDLTHIYKSDTDPQMSKDREATKRGIARFVRKWKTDDRYAKDPKILLKALTDFETLQAKYFIPGKEGLYILLRRSQDSIADHLKAMENKNSELFVELHNQLEFFSQAIKKIPNGDRKKFLKFKPLAKYKHFLERFFRSADHILDEEAEKVLVAFEKTAYENWVNMLDEFIYKESRKSVGENGKKAERTFQELLSLVQSKKKAVRDQAAENINEILSKHKEVAIKEINSVIESKRVEDKLRKYSRPDEERHIGDDVDSSVVDSLVKTVTESNSISTRFYKLKAKLLGVKKLKYYERLLSVGKINKKYSFAKSKEIVLRSFKELSPIFYNTAEKFFDQRRIDVYPRKGKTGGAFAIGSITSVPSYILLNHADTLSNLLTLAHELGHGINYDLTKESQNQINQTWPTSTAEVASTFFEGYVQERISEDMADEDKLTFLMESIDADIASIFRQIALYNFETEIHNEFARTGYLSDETLSKLFIKWMKSYLGPTFEMEKGAENWWIYWSHIRRFFYVYSYASGGLISKSLLGLVKKDPANVKKVETFLRTGGSESPAEIFRRMGIDIEDPSFWKIGLSQIRSDISQAEKLAKKLGRI